MSKKRKEQLCRVCKKRPVWIGGDVKNPGHVCKKCYHAHMLPERERRRGQIVQGAATPEQRRAVKQQKASKPLKPSRTKRKTEQREQEECGPTTLTLTLPLDLVVRMISHCEREGLEFEDMIQTLLLEEYCPQERQNKPAVTQPSTPRPARSRFRLVQ